MSDGYGLLDVSYAALNGGYYLQREL